MSARKGRLAHVLRVRARPGDRTRGWLVIDGRALPVALGRGGIRANKREGDGGTPRGRFRLIRLWFRPDARPRPTTALPSRAIRPTDGWCEDPRDRRYNRPVVRPVDTPHERMWRDDALYDYVIEISHNRVPRIAGRGSAVFVHLARPGYTPTAGCVALSRRDLASLLARVGPHTVIDIA